MFPRIAMLSTYPPTHCGIATFARSLSGGMAKSGAEIGVVALGADDGSGDAAVVQRHRSAADHDRTVRTLNSFDAVVVQHEFGIYDGTDGDDVISLIADIVVPVITVVHTVPMAPSLGQRRILQTLLNVSDVVVVLSHAAGRLLRRMYRVRPRTLRMIPHGAPDLATARLSVDEIPPRILTWGLIGRGKGMEWGVRALANMSVVTDAEYLIAGATHPKVLAHEGEAYREHVQELAEEFGVANRVRFVDDYLTDERLRELIAESAVFLLPYDSKDQVTSGVLIEAVAAGGPVVATRFPHAVELLMGGTGMLVNHKDPFDMAFALDAVLGDPQRQREMRARSRAVSKGLHWDRVGESYVELADSLWRRRGGGPIWDAPSAYSVGVAL